MFFFFFSSRRRHTRLQGDWSSDVCSSDLGAYDIARNRAVVNVGVTHDTAEFAAESIDRKSTRQNSSHLVISYGVFCLKKTNSASIPPRRPQWSTIPSTSVSRRTTR